MLLGLAAIAFGAGAFFRFWGLGDAPLAVDEYYLATSILNLMERGLPEFPCGGYYSRGVLLQYLSTVPVYFGANLELAVRLIPAISSIFAIAAVWKLSLRAGGVSVACVATVLASLSLWEIEFARFGRMYSPFQAIFLWYTWFQLKHLVDQDRVAQVVYLLLSAISIFVYAGAAMLLALNFLPLLWPEKRWSIRHLVASSGLMVCGLYYYRIDFRFMDVPESLLPPLSTIDDTATSLGPSLPLPVEVPFIPGSGPIIIIVGTIAFALLLWTHYKEVRLTHPSAILWLLASVVMSFGLISFGIALALLGGLMHAPLPLKNTTHLRKRLIQIYVPGLILLATIIFLGVTIVATDFVSAAKSTLNYVFNYPDVYYKIVRPWLHTIPITTVVLATLVVPLFWSSVKQTDEQLNWLAPSRYLFSILIALVLLVGLLKQPYVTTRYTYFLYPVVLVLASMSIVRLARRMSRQFSPWAPLFMIGGLAVFLITEDWGVGHLVRINEPEVRYRLRYDDKLAGHYYKRWDFRGVGEYTNLRIGPDDNVIVFHQALPHYLRRTDGIFIRKGSTIHSIVWGCGGTRELWSNAPLLDEEHEVRQLIDSNKAATWLIMHTSLYPWRDKLEADLATTYSLTPNYTSVDGNLAVYRISGEETKVQE
jgi:hypothetical protein